MKGSNSVLNGKKGNIVLDGIFILIVFFVFAILGFTTINISDDINTDLQQDDSLSNSTKTRLDNLNDRTPDLMDNIFIFMLVLMFGFVIAASLVVDVNPLFFIFAIILLVSLFLVTGYMSNTYEELADDEEIGGAQTTMPKTYFVMTHLVETIIIMTFVVLLALYGKSRLG